MTNGLIRLLPGLPLAVALLLCSWARGAAPGVNRERLAALAPLPTVNLQTGFVLSTSDLLSSINGREEWPAEIARLHERLKKEPEDQAALRDLGRLLAKSGATNAATRLQEKRVQILRAQVKTRPNDGELLADLGNALNALGQREEAEAVLRRATIQSPDVWQAWAGLGQTLMWKSVRILVAPAREAGVEVDLHSPQSRKRLLDHPPSPGDLARCEQLLTAAGQALDQAVEVAPDGPEVYYERGASRMVLSSAQQAVDLLQGKSSDEVNPVLRTYGAALPDIKKAASLSQTNYRAWAWSAFVEFVQHNKPDSTPRDLDELPATSRRFIREAMTRLRAMGDHPNPSVAAGALDGLTSVQLITGSARPSEAIEHLSRAVKLDPDRSQTWDFLIGLLGSEEGRTRELIETCRRRVAHRDSTRNRLFLIKALDRAGRVDAALAEANVVLEQHPGDETIHLCAAALLMHKDTSEETLRQAATHLARAEAGLKRLDLPKDLRTLPLDLALTKAVWLALSGHVEPAKKYVDQVLKLAPKHPRAAEIQAQLKYWQ